jgi:hypothetical protein
MEHMTLEGQDLVTRALIESVRVMEAEKEAWGGACDTYDKALELCAGALRELSPVCVESQKAILKLKKGAEFTIDGFWNEHTGKGKPFTGYTCLLGKWEGKEDEKDERIFYYFETKPELKQAMVYDGSGDFTVTRVYEN